MAAAADWAAFSAASAAASSASSAARRARSARSFRFASQATVADAAEPHASHSPDRMPSHPASSISSAYSDQHDLLASAIESPLHQWLATLPEAGLALQPDRLAEALSSLNDHARLDKLVNDVNHVISLLESQLATLRSIQYQLGSKA